MADNPLELTEQLKQKVADLRDQMRVDIPRLEDVQARALLETSAEVLGGLYKAFDDYEKKNEPAWQRGKSPKPTEQAEQKDKPIGNVGPPNSGSPTHG
ncbi:MAG: hypothetical protein ACLFUB_14120 [Cyclobacteriaceae bacterium]